MTKKLKRYFNSFCCLLRLLTLQCNKMTVNCYFNIFKIKKGIKYYLNWFYVFKGTSINEF